MDIKDKIIDGSLKMFSHYGIRSITMDMIAKELGISKRTIYENFKDKDELLKCCLDKGMSDHKKRIEEMMKDSENIIEATIKFVKHHVAMFKTVNPIFFRDIQTFYHDLNKNEIKCNNTQNINHLTKLLEKGIQKKYFRNEINVEIVAILFMEQFKLLNYNNIFPEEKFSKAEVFENIVINFMRGIVTEKGFSLIEKYNK